MACLKDCLFVFGGSSSAFSDELFQFDIASRTWREVKPSGLRPKARHFHSLVAHQDSLWLFGGKSNGYMSDVWRFDLARWSWQEMQLEPGTSGPSKRYGHSAVVHGNVMYMYGGYDDMGFACSDLWALELSTSGSTCRWRQVKAQGSSGPERFHHTAAVLAGSMVVFGGYGGFNDLYEFRFGTQAWYGPLQARGQPPAPRWGHRAAVALGSMYVLGGCDSVINYSDAFRLDWGPAGPVWERLPSRGYSQRFFHSLVAHGDCLYAFGGKNIHNFNFNELHIWRPSGPQLARDRPDSLLRDLTRLFESAEGADLLVQLLPASEPESETELDSDSASSMSASSETGARSSSSSSASASPCAPDASAEEQGHEGEAAAAACFLVHRNIVMARCAKLYRQVERRGRPDASGSRIVLQLRPEPACPLSPSLLRHLLRYLYTSEVHFDANEGEKQACALLIIACYYRLDHLASLAEARLVSLLQPSQAVDTLVFLERHRLPAPDLRDYCIQLVASRPDLLAQAKAVLSRDLLQTIKRASPSWITSLKHVS
jgi:N-acetylneuraminic acid mutarotase